MKWALRHCRAQVSVLEALTARIRDIFIVAALDAFLEAYQRLR